VLQGFIAEYFSRILLPSVSTSRHSEMSIVALVNHTKIMSYVVSSTEMSTAKLCSQISRQIKTNKKQKKREKKNGTCGEKTFPTYIYIYIYIYI